MYKFKSQVCKNTNYCNRSKSTNSLNSSGKRIFPVFPTLLNFPNTLSWQGSSSSNNGLKNMTNLSSTHFHPLLNAHLYFKFNC